MNFTFWWINYSLRNIFRIINGSNCKQFYQYDIHRKFLYRAIVRNDFEKNWVWIYFDTIVKDTRSSDYLKNINSRGLVLTIEQKEDKVFENTIIVIFE